MPNLGDLVWLDSYREGFQGKYLYSLVIDIKQDSIKTCDYFRDYLEYDKSAVNTFVSVWKKITIKRKFSKYTKSFVK